MDIFPGKMRSDRPTVVDRKRKKKKGLALLCFASGPLQSAANSSDVPIEFAAELKKEKVLKDRFQFVT